MSKLRTSALAAAAILLLVHGVVLIFRYGTDTASLWGDWIDTAAPLIGAVVCWMVSRKSGPFGSRVWRLVAISNLISAYRPGSLHLLLRLPARAARHDLAERCACVLLGCARGNDAVSESARSRQGIRLAASLRFCAGVHARPCRGAFADLCSLPLAGCRTGDAGPVPACGDFFL